LITAKKKTLDPTGISWPDGVRIKSMIVPQTIGKSTMIPKICPNQRLVAREGAFGLPIYGWLRRAMKSEVDDRFILHAV
jgi:hypothetical protein